MGNVYSEVILFSKIDAYGLVPQANELYGIEEVFAVFKVSV